MSIEWYYLFGIMCNDRESRAMSYFFSKRNSSVLVHVQLQYECICMCMVTLGKEVLKVCIWYVHRNLQEAI